MLVMFGFSERTMLGTAFTFSRYFFQQIHLLARFASFLELCRLSGNLSPMLDTTFFEVTSPSSLPFQGPVFMVLKGKNMNCSTQQEFQGTIAYASFCSWKPTETGFSMFENRCSPTDVSEKHNRTRSALYCQCSKSAF